jgi:hypothetical protein
VPRLRLVWLVRNRVALVGERRIGLRPLAPKASALPLRYTPMVQKLVGNPGAAPGVSCPRSRRITAFLVPDSAGLPSPLRDIHVPQVSLPAPNSTSRRTYGWLISPVSKTARPSFPALSYRYEPLASSRE